MAGADFSFEIGAVADDDSGEDEGNDAGGDEGMGLFGRAFPLLEEPAPHGGEDDDGGHVKGP